MKRSLIIFSIITSFILCCAISHSCANTTTPPSGGPKDTIPPVLISVSPENNSTNFPLTDGKIQLLYNEYTIVKNASEIIVSPPSKKKPVTKIKNKYIVVSFNDTLQADKTYTIDFGNTLVDNNEGNVAPRFVYTFSTGDVIDSMYVTGTVTDSKTLQPVKNLLVALYSDMSDSACFNVMPDAATKSDDWGFFLIRNVKPIPYQLIGFSDTDNDYKYDPNSDQIAFVDTLIIPRKVVNDSVYELGSFIIKDTARCKARESMYNITLFKELQSVQYLQNSGRIEEKVGFLKFSAADVIIKNFEIVGVKDSLIITQMNDTKDSMLFWINSKNRMEDSLLIRLTYMATDSIGNLVDSTTNLSLAIPDDVKKAMKEKANAAPDTTFNLSINISDETMEQDGATVTLDYPALAVSADSIRILAKNPKGQTDTLSCSLERDSTDIRRYIIHQDDAMKEGYEYELQIPAGAFVNLKGLPNNPSSSKYQIPKSDNLSILTIVAQDVQTRYIIELMDNKMSKVYRKYVIDSDKSLLFPYLKAGSYSLRITEDKNNNGIFDAGNFMMKRQPEKVLFYEVTPGNQTFEIPEKMDIEQEINLKEMFE